MSEVTIGEIRDVLTYGIETIEALAERVRELERELEKERKYVKCDILCRCEDPYSAASLLKKEATRAAYERCVEIVQEHSCSNDHTEPFVPDSHGLIRAIRAEMEKGA